MTRTPWTFGSPLFDRRRAGVLLHPSSLPSSRTSGDLGEAAYRFVDFLARAGFTVWQMLPIGPTQADRSPYQSPSAHAGNLELISLEQLAQEGLLSREDLQDDIAKKTLVEKAAAFFLASAAAGEAEGQPIYAAYRQFCEDNRAWLDDYALYTALHRHFGGAAWNEWPQPIRARDAEAVAAARLEHAFEIAIQSAVQFFFHQQWQALRDYAQQRSIHLFGDMPIFVSHDSADVWANQTSFKLDAQGNPVSVAGVPPDYFSATGQHWGNPHYHWDYLQQDGFRWWIDRVQHQLRYFDLLRVDHFRGFEAYWAIPAHEPQPSAGHWEKAPGEAFLKACQEAMHRLPLVAENLGVITPEVEALRQKFGLPGMLILQFAFDGSPENPYLPHNHDELEVVYTGTHDNETTLAWYQSLDPSVQKHLRTYFGDPQDPIPRFLIKTAFASVARMAIIPMQDLLGLGEGNRMNTPGTVAGNWRWQFQWAQLPDGLADEMRDLLRIYRRLPGEGRWD